MAIRYRMGNMVTHLVLIIGSIFMILPFVWMVLISLKPDSELMSLNWIPHEFSWNNYTRAWQSAPFGTFFRNSIIVTVTATFGQILTSAMAGYAFSKINFVGRKPFFVYMLLALMVPIQSIIIPLYLNLTALHWTNTLTGLIVPMAVSAFGAFQFKQFFDGLPDELQDAAYMDGAGYATMFVRIFLPLCKPVIASFGILSFLFNWNNFFYPLIVVSSTNVQTLPLGLASFTSNNVTYYNLLMAASTLTIIPVLVVFVFLQKYFVEGIAMSGIK
jgi:multiple sugar transport system permease protein